MENTPDIEFYYEYCLNRILEVRKAAREIKEKNDLSEERKKFSLEKLENWEKYYLSEMARCKEIISFNVN